MKLYSGEDTWGAAPWDNSSVPGSLFFQITNERPTLTFRSGFFGYYLCYFATCSDFFIELILEFLETQFYLIENFGENLVSGQLENLGVASVFVIFFVGLLTSLTPCMLSMLPITVSYIGAYESQGKLYGAIQSAWFAFGLATTLAMLGAIATALGKVYGQIGLGLPFVVSLIAIIMGLNLLGVIPLQLPNLDLISYVSDKLPRSVRSYMFGLTFGLVASPCSTPVLATLLGWVSATQDLLLGTGLLLIYAMGYVLPLVIAGTFTASIAKILELRKWSGWINPVSGLILIGFGLFSFLTRLPVSIY